MDRCLRAEMYAQVKNEMKRKVGQEPKGGSKKRSCARKEGSLKIGL